ncbi:MAG: YgiQ family radical SAM protein [Candidatus Delongbacteria bacterium]|nr:YgiQ family radical SAM protein [Candidatus Delongbacteria bacterium]
MLKGFLPNNSNEFKKLGWKQADIIIVTGDAYVDHPNFSVAVCGKFLDKNGYKVAVLDMPRVNEDEDWKILGKPRLFFLVITGEEDSMVSNYTPYMKLKTSDQYLPGNKKINRPDRALIRYCNKIKEMYKNSKIVVGGVEAAGRMAAHYDFWSDKIRKPVLFDSKADVLLYGNMEYNLVSLADQIKISKEFKNLHSLDGIAYISNEPPQKKKFRMLPEFLEVEKNKDVFIEHEKILHSNQNPYNSEILVQRVLNRYLVINRPGYPLETNDIDSIYSTSFTLKPHPKYKEDIPAYNRMKDQIPTHRGTINSLSYTQDIFTQGRFISSRSKSSILRNIIYFTNTKVFNKMVNNFYGIRSNYFGISLRSESKCKKCDRLSCIIPTVCSNLSKGTNSMIEISKEVDILKNIRNNFYASDVDVALLLSDNDAFKEYVMKRVNTYGIVNLFNSKDRINDLTGQQKYEATVEFIESFLKRVGEYSKKHELKVNVLAGHPGENYNDTVDNVLELIKFDLSINQITPFLPLPMTISACHYFTGKDPFERGEVEVNKKISEKKNMVALYNYKSSSNFKTVHRILHELDRKKDINKILKNK